MVLWAFCHEIRLAWNFYYPERGWFHENWTMEGLVYNPNIDELDFPPHTTLEDGWSAKFTSISVFIRSLCQSISTITL